jgi:hypothetical protein
MGAILDRKIAVGRTALERIKSLVIRKT